MVNVPAGAAVRFSLKRPGAFWIDRYEVSNEQFKRFVDAGGYRDRKYWKEPLVKDGQALSWDQAMQEFRDATGRPGPSAWELGTYPEGREQYPVGGVSWYEAAAYAEFAGKQLPTIYHYYAAAFAWISAEELQASNFSGKGPTPITANHGLNWVGAYDMAGNVREWCWNRAGGERFAAGGAWNELAYSFTRADITRPPFDRSGANGFRCMKIIDPIAPDLSASDPQTVRNFKVERAVGETAYQGFLRMYAYDPTPLNPKLESEREEPNWRVEKVSFDAAYRSERVPAYLFLPKNTLPPYQAVVYYPTLNALLNPTSEILEIRLIRFLMQSGRAVLYPVYQGTYERRIRAESPTAERDRSVEIAKDLRRSIDYLQTRRDIDSRRLAFYGFSQGAIFGPQVTAIEDRFQASILAAGGYYTGPVPLPEMDPLNFAPRVRVPTLMINGRDDPLFPVETSQLPLFQSLGTPAEHKRHALLEGGHVPTRMQDLIREALGWLDKYLGPVQLRPN